MGVAPALLDRIERLGEPTERYLRMMYAVSLSDAIARYIQKQEIDNGNHN